jgi:hypothetical protein
LVGGVLSESWPLLNVTERNPKLEYSGLKKIGDKQVHALKYTPRKGSDLKIVLHFDAKSFRHVRTDYSRTVYPSEQRRIAGDWPGLPPSIQSEERPAVVDWVFNVNDYSFTSPLDAAEFTFGHEKK